MLIRRAVRVTLLYSASAATDRLPEVQSTPSMSALEKEILRSGLILPASAGENIRRPGTAWVALSGPQVLRADVSKAARRFALEIAAV